MLAAVYTREACQRWLQQGTCLSSLELMADSTPELRETLEALALDAGGRLWRFAEILAKTTDVLGSREAAQRWLASCAGLPSMDSCRVPIAWPLASGASSGCVVVSVALMPANLSFGRVSQTSRSKPSFTLFCVPLKISGVAMGSFFL